jgi:hypothetical protein
MIMRVPINDFLVFFSYHEKKRGIIKASKYKSTILVYIITLSSARALSSIMQLVVECLMHLSQDVTICIDFGDLSSR